MQTSLIRQISLTVILCFASTARSADPPPFNHKVEVFYDEKTKDMAFVVRLEQPFLAEEFESSNFLRLKSGDDRAYLIYPRETRFQQKHAEFYGRLRGKGKVTLKLTYETVRENLDGTRKIESSESELELDIPTIEGGPISILREWAEHQNQYFLDLLQQYPEESFFEYCLLQSASRYGVTPPTIPSLAYDQPALKKGLYEVFTGSRMIQESLQRSTFAQGQGSANYTVPIYQLTGPSLQSLDYEALLKKRADEDKVLPQVHEISKLVPADQYFLHFHSPAAAGDLFDLSLEWADSLLRAVRTRAEDARLRQKLETQLCVKQSGLEELFAAGAITEFALTGADPYLLEGTDISLLIHAPQIEEFRKHYKSWVDEARGLRGDLVERQFNYRGHEVQVRYTDDRTVSTFLVEQAPYVMISNSHRGIRAVIDTSTGKSPALYDALDYRYVTTLLPPTPEQEAGYFFASEEFIKRNISPQNKISEKRRLQCFNNLVMLNNASLFYRLENDQSPQSISDLAEGKYVDLSRVVCPHGGSYSYDVQHDACTCSLHNRLKLLTPNSELSIQKVSVEEQQEYEQYKQHYRAFWGTVFDPIAVRFSVGKTVTAQVCILPTANGPLYQQLRGQFSTQPQNIDTSGISQTAIASTVAVMGREQIGEFLRSLPGIHEAIDSDPTLSDLAWLGDQVSAHLCDDDMVLEIDPTRLAPLQAVFIGNVSSLMQFGASVAVWATSLPVYFGIQVEDADRAERMLEQLAQKAFLQQGQILGLSTKMDSYRLPDHHGHAMYVLSYQIHAIKIRLYLSVVGHELVAATQPETLQKVIESSENKPPRPPIKANVLVRYRRNAINKLKDDLEVYFGEKSRLACHRNSIAIYNLVKLYHESTENVDRLADAKYGVTYFCPDGGEYHYDADRDVVECSVHGNRLHARQHLRLDDNTRFSRMFQSLDEITLSLLMEKDAIMATIQLQRGDKEQPADQ